MAFGGKIAVDLRAVTRLMGCGMSEEAINYTAFGTPSDLAPVIRLLALHGLNPESSVQNCIKSIDATLTITGVGTAVALWKFLLAAVKMIRIRVKKKTENGWIEFEFNPEEEQKQKQILFQAGELKLWIGNGEPPSRK